MLRDEFIKRFTENQSKIDSARAEIIRCAIDIDVFLERIIAIYFVEDPIKNKQFSTHIGQREFFSFHKKIQVFRKLRLHEHEKYGNKFSELCSRLYSIEKIRNIVAHNIPMAHTPEIWYRDDDDRDKLLSLPDKLPDFRKDYDFCFRALGEVFADLAETNRSKR